MSLAAIRADIETQINAITPALATAWQNVQFTPVNGVPYQRVTLLLAEPDNQELTASFNEVGFFQIDLCYPQLTGSAAAEARAELLRNTFKRGQSFGVSDILITHTPEVKPAYQESDRYIITVRVRFNAFIVVT